MVLVDVTMFVPVNRLTPFFLDPITFVSVTDSTLPPMPALPSLALDFRGFGFFGARFVPIETTGLVGIMTIVPPPGDVVATVED